MPNKEYKNYLEHEICVKFADGILEHSQEWQWFIDYIEDNFDLSDIDDFFDFQNRRGNLIPVLSNFLHMLDVCDTDFHSETLLLQEIYLIAKYYVGVVERVNCSSKIKTEFCKILFVLVWLTKLENSDNNSKYIVDYRILDQRNFHQAINMGSFEYDKEEIFIYLEEITIRGFEEVKQNIKDNLNKVNYDVTEHFFEKYSDNLVSVNCFSYQSLDRDAKLTWQEHTLLDMLQISINNGQISPMFSIGSSSVPDYLKWSPQLVKGIKEYFNHRIADFVIESINFVVNKNPPSLETIETHCKLLAEAIKNSDNYHKIRMFSSFEIIALLFKEGVMNKVEKTEDIKKFYKIIHSVTSINLLLVLRQFFPLSRSQLRSIKNYIENQYKGISLIKDIESLIQYLQNSDIARYINQECYDEMKRKFFELMKGIQDSSVSILFYQAVMFLLDVNQTNQNLDKRVVKRDVIYLQEYWQENIYPEQEKNLQEFKYSAEIPTTEVEGFNDTVMNNPIFLANTCVISKVKDMIPVMEEVSKNPLNCMCDKIILSPIFPIKDIEINFEKHEIDNILKLQVEKILKEYGYKFLNDIDSKIYVSAINEKYRENANIFITMFNREEDLYSLLEELLDRSLIPYEKNVSLGHLTQLFPLLEIEIRRLGKMFGIVPFKENREEYFKFKDPSSILRELIDKIYQESDNFESVPELLFVYHFMYNSNSYNIRNECVHGRDYIEGYRLRFGFKVTLLALYMIVYRISLIQSAISKNKDN